MLMKCMFYINKIKFINKIMCIKYPSTKHVIY